MAKTSKAKKPAGGWPRESQSSPAERKQRLFDRVLKNLQAGRFPQEKTGHTLWFLSRLLGTWPELAVVRPPERACVAALGPLSVEDLQAVTGLPGSSKARVARVRERVFPRLFDAGFLGDLLGGLERAYGRAERPEEIEAVAWAFHYAAGAVQGAVPAAANELLSLLTFTLLRESNELAALGRQVAALDHEVAAGTLSREERQQRLQALVEQNPVLRFAYQRAMLEDTRALIGGVLAGTVQARLSREGLRPLLEELSAAAQAAGAKDAPTAFARFLVGQAQWGTYERFASDAANAPLFDRFGADLAAEAAAAREAAAPNADALEAAARWWETTVRGSVPIKAQLCQVCVLVDTRGGQGAEGAPPPAPAPPA